MPVSIRPARNDVKLFQAVLNGEHLLRGFRNAEIREALYGSTEDAGTGVAKATQWAECSSGCTCAV